MLKFTPLTAAGNADKEGNIRNEVPEPKSSTVDSPAIQDSSSATSLADSQKKNVSLSEVEALLHHALDAASGDEMGSAFSGNGVGEPVNIFFMEYSSVTVVIKLCGLILYCLEQLKWCDITNCSLH